MALPHEPPRFYIGICLFFFLLLKSPLIFSSFLRLCIRYWDPRQKRLAFFCMTRASFYSFWYPYYLLCFALLFLFLVCAWRFDLLVPLGTGLVEFRGARNRLDTIFVQVSPLIYADVDVDV
ncbi:hypothetical protein BDQ94DRAFT_144069 [Aspergillus welwitschiae]|uniref:Uncharacterized protein n=1 Tax=Aspergillus welwitschiae TaxID=1341132 RepID=A0A3F3Q2R8_9EURO|nr:hypothetical protein BDQ94DRAFT_144069 [Aspergillus welwitschiae]RDH33395.1 hypothetical protein BDQ94DRAFT_144069 [Aspergillus welwitschiae]